jgi:hypothetical protein
VSLYALVSAGGSPGVTTSALALTLGWPSQVILAECDPSGGDVLAGLFAGHLPATKGIVSLALAAGQSPDAVTAALWPQLVELDDERSRLLLPGVSDPRQGAGLAPAWPVLASALAGLPADVIADCGRLDANSPAYVLHLAAVAVLVLRPSLRQVSRARSRVEMLTQIMGGPDRLALLLVGEGTHTPREISKALGLAVAGTLPHDRKTAAVLSDGAGSRRGLPARPLIRAAASAGRALRTAAGVTEPPRPGGRRGSKEPGTGPRGAGQHGAAQHGAAQHGAAQHGPGQHGTSQHGAGQRGTGQHAAGHAETPDPSAAT